MTLIAIIPKNTREEIRVSLDEFNGFELINLRVWFDAGNGDKRPGKQGLAIRVELLPELLSALENAERAASIGETPKGEAA